MVGPVQARSRFTALLVLLLAPLPGRGAPPAGVLESIRALDPYYVDTDGDTVTEVSFHGSKRLRDAALKLIGRLSGLQSLSLSVTQITDDSLNELESLKSLKTLKLNSTRVTDAGLAPLGRI